MWALFLHNVYNRIRLVMTIWREKLQILGYQISTAFQVDYTSNIILFFFLLFITERMLLQIVSALRAFLSCSLKE